MKIHAIPSAARVYLRLGELFLILLQLAILPVGTGRALTNNLALTPPMGWNSWNHFGCNIDESIIKSEADAMKASGLEASGYQFINIDDCWQNSRGSNGVITADPSKFPGGIKALADYVHSDGLKFGLYSDHGYATCAGRPGGYGYEYLDANTYASWGVDYLKYDNCNQPPGDNTPADYARMSDALIKSEHPITFSLCFWTFDSWEPGVGNLWRTTGDISDSYASMISQIDPSSQSAFVAGPGRWNDPDMLEVGNGGMTATEDQTHFTMWCIMAAPLILGDDLTSISPQTLAILTNAEVIAVDQDPAGEQGVKVVNNLSSTSTNEVWSKTLGYDFSTKAVVLFNRNGPAATMTCNWTNIGLRAGSASVRDLWAHADLGTFTNSFTTHVASHAAVMLEIVGTPPPLPALGTNYLSDLQPIYTYVGWGTMTKDRSIGGDSIKLGGVTYNKGLGVHAFSGIEYNLGGVASRFRAVVGVDDEEIGQGPGSVDFQVYADGAQIYDSGVMYTNTPPKTIDLDVTGVGRLVLGVNDADDGINFDHADWANALVIVSNTVPAPPHAPTGLTASPGNSIGLAWNTTLGAIGYNIKRSTNNGASYVTIGLSPVAGYSDTNAVLGINYDYVVSATNRFGESANSAEASVTPCSPPVTPTNVSTSVTNSNVTVSWNAVPGATSYTVARAISSTPFTTIASGITGTKFTDTSTKGGGVYFYIVTAANSCGQSGPSAFAAAVDPLVPTAKKSIGIHFAGCQSSIGGNTPEAMTYADVAGVIPQTNWNNVDLSEYNSGGLAQITGPNAGVISDNSGAATRVTFSYAAQGMWSVDQNTHTGNQQLLNGYSDVESSASGHYNFGGIPYSLYDVYVYVSSDTDGRIAGVDINGGPQLYLLTCANGFVYSSPLIQATATAQSLATVGQYVLFRNVARTNLQVDLNWYGQNVGLAAIQIVPGAVWLTNSWNGSNFTVTWPGSGSLLQATNLTGPWTTNPAVSPATMAPTSSQMFFRTVQ